eukprot:6090493-Pleurochrysis_carterae.AAC.1
MIEHIVYVLRGRGEGDITKGRYPTYLRDRRQRDRAFSCARTMSLSAGMPSGCVSTRPPSPGAAV